MDRFMRAVLAAIAAGAAAGAAGCGSGTPVPAARTAGGPCAPVPGRQLVVLTDDKHVQEVNNIVPAVNARAASQRLLSALDAASAALTGDRLIALNKATDADHTAPKDAAAALASSARLADGIGKGGSGKVVIGATDVNESQSVAFLYQIALSAAGYDATVEPMGDRELYLPALEKGEIQVMPEYLGTLTDYLNTKVNGPAAAPASSGDQQQTAASLTRLGGRLGLAFGRPAPAANQNAFAVTRALADRYRVHTLSDFGAKCPGGAVILGGPAECRTASYCEPALSKSYGIDVRKFVPLDVGGPKTKQALIQGKISIGLVFSSDAALAG